MRKLGKGLSELGLSELLKPPVEKAERGAGQLISLPIDNVFPGPYQPRRQFEAAALNELADSIRAQGVLQPIIVRKKQGGHYEIIAGERRWRAAKMAGLEHIAAITREVSDQTAVAFALIENIQRRDLNAIEEAQALQRLLQEFHLTHEEVAQAVGKSRAAVTNLLRLLQLNPEVQALLSAGDLEKGHAIVLLALEGEAQNELAQQVAAQKWSVRETEVRVRQKQHTSAEARGKAEEKNIVPVAYQQNLSEKLGAKVMIRHNTKGKGKIVVYYHSLDELAGILTHVQ